MRAALTYRALAAAVGGAVLLMTHSLVAGDREIILSVPGIPGPYCAYGVEKRLFELDGVQRVDLLWKEEKIRVLIADGKVVTSDQIIMAVKKSDYPFEYNIVGQ